MIGDVLLSSTICSSLRKSFPDSQIDFLVYAPSDVLFEQQDQIDTVISLTPGQRKNPFKYFFAAWRVSRNRYDIIIDATSTAKTELISLMSPRATFRIGREKGGRGLFYTHRVPKREVNKIEQRVAMLAPLTAAGYPISIDRQIRMSLSADERSSARAAMISHGVNMGALIFAFSVSSKLAYRMWNLDYMQQVATHCLQRYKAQIVVLTGMPHEKPTIDLFSQGFGQHQPVFSSIDAPGLRDLAALLSHCHLYVGNEGAPRHIAEAVGVPSVAVVSPTASRAEWIMGGRTAHQAVEWQDLNSDEDADTECQPNDPNYLEHYNSIKPEHVIALIDDVVEKHLITKASV